MRNALADLRQFIARGTLVDLAVAVVVGVAFAAVVKRCAHCTAGLEPVDGRVASGVT